MIDTSDSIVSGLSQAANHPIRYAAQDSINGKISTLSSFCSSYPMTTFISSNKQMNRKDGNRQKFTKIDIIDKNPRKIDEIAKIDEIKHKKWTK